MTHKRLMLAVFFLAAVPTASLLWWSQSTSIDTTVKLRCGRYSIWCYRIGLYEFDKFDSDQMDFYGVNCVYWGWTSPSFQMSGHLSGDGIFDNLYELGVTISHNCTSNGKIKKITKMIDGIPTRTKKVVRDWVVEITDDGENVEMYT